MKTLISLNLDYARGTNLSYLLVIERVFFTSAERLTALCNVPFS